MFGILLGSMKYYLFERQYKNQQTTINQHAKSLTSVQVKYIFDQHTCCRFRCNLCREIKLIQSLSTKSGIKLLMSVSIIIFRTADAHFSQLKSVALILKDPNFEYM